MSNESTTNGGNEMRTVKEIKSEIKTKMEWAKKQNAIHGGAYDYTDTSDIRELMEELQDAENAEWNDVDIVTTRRAAWNKDVKSGMKKGDLYDKYGYSFHVKLVDAIKRLGL